MLWRGRRRSEDVARGSWEIAAMGASRRGDTHWLETVAVSQTDSWSLTDIKDPEGSNCGHYAARGGHVGALTLLAAAGLNLNARNSYLSTPLHEAVQAGHLMAVKWLVKRGGDPTQRDIFGCNCLDIAAR